MPALSPDAQPAPLRFGLVEAPEAGAFFVARDPAGGPPRGAAALLAADLARRAGRPLEPVLFPNSGECTEAVAAGQVDAAFMPVDAFRRERVAFGPAYYDLESTFLVSAASGLDTLDSVRRPDARVLGIAGTTTIRAAARFLDRDPLPARTAAEAIAALRNGSADALALSRDSLEQIAPGIPGSRITPGGFQHTTISLAVPPTRPDSLRAMFDWLDDAKRDGTVRACFAALGLPTDMLSA